MRLILSMTFAGSLMVLVYFVTNMLLKKVLTSKWRRYILLLVLFYYLIPIQMGKNFFINIWSFFGVKRQQNKIVDLTNKAVFLTPNGNYYYPISKLKTIILIVWELLLLF